MNNFVKHVGRLAQSAFRLVRLDLFRYRPSHHYVSDIYGHAAFKQIPLNDLPIFGELASQVIQDKRSTLYYDRLHTLYQALAYLKMHFKPSERLNLVEVGVYRGGTSYFIASVAEHFKMKAVHHAFDTFEGHDARDVDVAVDPWHSPGTFGDTQFESVKQYLSRFNNVSVFKGRFQDTCHELRNSRIHFVHFDVDIYDPTVFGLHFFHKRLAPGGVIVVDDYGFTTCPGVKKAVDEFVAVTPGYFPMSLLTGQYLLVKFGN